MTEKTVITKVLYSSPVYIIEQSSKVHLLLALPSERDENGSVQPLTY